MGSSSRELDVSASGESVVVVRRRPAGQQKQNRQKRWSVAGGPPDRQSICFSGGFLSLSPVQQPAQQPAARSSWRHSYACDQQILPANNNNRNNKLDSIREEENDVAARSATMRAHSTL